MVEYTQNGLPIVEPEIIQVLLRDWRRINAENKSPDLSIDIIRNLVQENPYLYEFAIKTTRRLYKTKSNQEPQAFLTGFCAAYELLRRQQETNQLEQTISR